ncbi:DeoR/GlpR family DNA-binding transcription regulator [Kineococcus sp. SYSU DK003]|uniref:DeoR/GlpR family DNA-binding transcription regulator n=1 Tax=Kineococcus sp. SYSU DK003 TaxID=3383124 RepID=UPI003D7D775D
MLAHQRQEVILEAVRTQGGVRVAELVEQLGVSEMTVRRDIGELSRQGLVARVHGGAAALGRSSEEPGFAAKSTLRTEAKQAIAREAARFVEQGSSVALSAGTTTVAVARELRTVADLTVVTNSPRVADVLHEPDRTVVLSGGIRTPSDALVGPVALAGLRGLHVDVLFLGVHGFDVAAGLSTPNLLEADTDRALMDCAARVVVVADASKRGVVGLSSFAPLDAVDVLVTDDSLTGAARAELEHHVGELVVASPEGPQEEEQ